MGIPVLILGESGSGKSASMRNLDPEKARIFNVASKPLPFRAKLRTLNGAIYPTIKEGISRGTVKTYVIDDSQYLMANEFFDRAKEQGYNKFTDIGLHFRDLLEFVIRETPKDCIVYFLHHVELDANGRYKAKTIGKMLDEKLTVEGLFSIVLLCVATKDKHVFLTQGQGISSAKSPMDMFPEEIDNDLALVDATIRDYYSLVEDQSDKEDKEEPKQ